MLKKGKINLLQKHASISYGDIVSKNTVWNFSDVDEAGFVQLNYADNFNWKPKYLKFFSRLEFGMCLKYRDLYVFRLAVEKCEEAHPFWNVMLPEVSKQYD